MTAVDGVDYEKRYLTHTECMLAVQRMRLEIPNGYIYGVPRGGVPVAYLMQGYSVHPMAEKPFPNKPNIFVDDIVDTGATRDRYLHLYPGSVFYALADYLEPKRIPGQWIVFPWEQGPCAKDTSADDIVIRLLEYIGEDPKRDGLKETPQRVLKAWKELTSGYKQEPQAILTTFDSEKYDEMIFEKGLPYFSTCEHHLLPFFGTATIAYIPGKKIAGLSKLGRILDVFARRLQVQERLTVQVADALMEILEPVGVGVLVKARHLCMESRGYNKQGHETITSALRGKFVDPTVRAEFLSIAK